MLALAGRKSLSSEAASSAVAAKHERQSEAFIPFTYVLISITKDYNGRVMRQFLVF